MISLGLELRTFFDQKYQRQRLLGRSLATVVDFHTTINRFEVHLGRTAYLSDLNDDRLCDFLNWLLEEGRGPATGNKHRSNLLALWRHAKRKGFLDELPDVPALPEYKYSPNSWSAAEVAAILKAAQEQKGRIAGIPNASWWPAFILVLFDTGARVNALLATPSRQLDLDKRTISLMPETQKQRCEQRFQLSEQACGALKKIDPMSRPVVFPWPYDRQDRSRQTLHRHYTRILQAAGLPHGARDKFHRLRRTHGSYVCAALGLEQARDALGHSSIAVTRRYVDPDRLKDRVNVLETLPRPEFVEPSRQLLLF